MRFLIILILIAIFDFSRCFAEETITSIYRPKCEFAGPSTDPKNKFIFSIKIKYPSKFIEGSFEQIFQGECNLKKTDELNIATLSGPTKDFIFDIHNIDAPLFKCENKGGVFIMTWGIHALIINQSTKKVIFSTEDGVKIETSCK